MRLVEADSLVGGLTTCRPTGVLRSATSSSYRRRAVVFSSVTFLFAFLPATLALYYLVPRRFGNGVLIVASLAFYTWGAGRFVVVFVGTTFIDYVLARCIGAARQRGALHTADRWLAVSVVGNLGVLGWFKYAMFATSLLNSAAGSTWSVGAIALPLAISFFTFQRMSYVIDVRRGDVEAVRRFDELLLCVCLFPHLIAGPIVRFAQLRDEIHSRIRSVDLFADGAVRFSWGLAKKVIVAGALAPVAAAVRRGSLQTRHAVGVDRSAGLHAADLLRLLGLLGHGHRARRHAGVPLPREL